MKSVIAMVLVGVMLSGFAITASASDVITDHTHNYSSTGVYVCYNTFCTGTHQYISGWNTDVQTGTSTPIYSLCSIMVKQYRAEMKCNCGATNGYDYRTETYHMNCGQ